MKKLWLSVFFLCVMGVSSHAHAQAASGCLNTIWMAGSGYGDVGQACIDYATVDPTNPQTGVNLGTCYWETSGFPTMFCQCTPAACVQYIPNVPSGGGGGGTGPHMSEGPGGGGGGGGGGDATLDD